MNWFDTAVSVNLLKFLIILYNGLFQNMGLAIIALTLIVRAILLWLTIKQLQASRNMALKTREVQPKVQALKAKYAKDKKKLGEETMKLYKESGMNPLGCLSAPLILPMLIQLPIWIGLYRAIMLSMNPVSMATLGLQTMNNHFMWLDLAVRDPYYILPVLVALVMWLSQEVIRIPSGDPQQDMMQNMMRFSMPLMFGVVCIGFPSGLALFWLVSSVVQLMTEYPMYGWRGSKVLPRDSVVPTRATMGPDVDVGTKVKVGPTRERKAPAPAKHIPEINLPGQGSRREGRDKDGFFRNKRKDSGGGDSEGPGAVGPE